MSNLSDDILKARLDVVSGYDTGVGLGGRFARWDAIEPHRSGCDGHLLLEAIAQVLSPDHCMSIVMFVSSSLGDELRDGARELGIPVARPVPLPPLTPQEKGKAEAAWRRWVKRRQA